jgi:hypothetical protein
MMEGQADEKPDMIIMSSRTFVDTKNSLGYVDGKRLNLLSV